MHMYSVYIVQCSDGSLYTGIAKNVQQRVKTHNAGTGARYTRGRLPVSLVYREDCENRSAALQREAAIKKISRMQKRLLCLQWKAPVE